MKLLFIITSQPSLTVQGGSAFNAIFIEELTRKGIEVTVIRLRSINPTRPLCSKTILSDNVVCYTICAFTPPLFFRPVFLSTLFVNLMKKLCLDYDIVHAGSGWVAIAANIAARINSVEYVIQFIGDDINSDLKFLVRIKKYVNALSEAKFHIFNSAKLLEVFRSMYSPSEVPSRVIRRGVRLEEFKFHYNLGEEINIVFLGGALEGKGFFTLIKAINVIDKQIIRKKINFFIGGPSTINFRDNIKVSNNQIKVNFIGEIPREKVIKLLKIANIVLIPSLNEGIPNVLYEAMAAGNMVIASDVGGISEVMQDGVSGWLISPNNSSALANAVINAIIIENKLINFAQSGRSIVEELSYEKFLTSYISIYCMLVNSKNEKYRKI